MGKNLSKVTLMSGLLSSLFCLSPLSAFANSSSDKLFISEKDEWPTFRGDQRNHGFSQFPAIYQDDKAWKFQTSKGIFSTAVIDENSNIYVGSADTYFYALNPKGDVIWRLKTGEIIDSAALLTRSSEENYITIPSGDGKLYHLKKNDQLKKDPTKEILWTFDAHKFPHHKEVGYTWFEGNVTLGNNGMLLAGNTNWNFYAINGEDGSLSWKYPSKNMNWSAAAIDEQGYIYWTSLDRSIRKMNSEDGSLIWEKSTLGFNSSSVALDYEGRLFFGSFDSNLYALNQENGEILWKFKTNDHIYGSPALSLNSKKQLERIYITSTDGRLYCLSPSGQLIWNFDTESIIRSSPSINRSESNNDIIYFGAANGLLYAINHDGSFRWAYDTNSENLALKDRNDLNSSPALSEKGIIIGGEHGFISYVPYDYPLYNPDDSRSILKIEKQKDGIEISQVSSGWNNPAFPEPLAPHETINLKVSYYKNGERIKAGINRWHNATKISIEPNIAFQWEISGSGAEIYIQPLEFLENSQSYEVSIDGSLISSGINFGNLEIGASEIIPFSRKIIVKSQKENNIENLFTWFNNNDLKTFRLNRLSLPSPSMIASLNQIGFDSLNWLLRILDVQPNQTDPNTGKIKAWLTEAIPEGSPHNLTIPDNSNVHASLFGEYKGNSFILYANNLSLNVAGIDISISELTLRGTIDAESKEPQIIDVQARLNPFTDINYGPLLGLSGLVNSSLNIPISGNFLMHSYQKSIEDNLPEDFKVESVSARKQKNIFHKEFYDLKVKFSSKTLSKSDRKNFTLVWLDESKGKAISMRISNLDQIDENIWSIKEKIPAKKFNVESEKSTFYLIYNTSPIKLSLY